MYSSVTWTAWIQAREIIKFMLMERMCSITITTDIMKSHKTGVCLFTCTVYIFIYISVLTLAVDDFTVATAAAELHVSPVLSAATSKEGENPLIRRCFKSTLVMLSTPFPVSSTLTTQLRLITARNRDSCSIVGENVIHTQLANVQVS